ncbi:MAG: DNA translocase FtsK 4TM domain-containing protein [Bacteroidetes bacterium]|nr:DNA translocase FtsK 4TM domain-containing protein [Bacteroidota bacterium]
MSEKRNKFKNNDSESSEDKGEKKKISLKPFLKSPGLFSNEKSRKIIGLTLILFSFFLLIAFTSFLFTWQADQDKVFHGFYDIIFSSDIVVENWLGKMGAVLSHFFIHSWFGVASFLFTYLFFISGFKVLTGISIVPIKKSFRYTFFAIIWISASLGYAFHSNMFIMGGAFGFHAAQWLTSLLGYAGAGLLLVFAFIGAMVAVFNISFEFLKNIFSQADISEDLDENATHKVQESTFKSNTLNPDKKKEIEQEPTPTEELLDDMYTIAATEEEVPFILKKDVPETQEQELGLESTAPKIPVEEEGKDSDFVIETHVTEESEAEILKNQSPLGEYDPKLDLSSYKFPIIDLLEKHGSSSITINKEELEANKDRILETLKNYNISIAKIKATIGPTVTLYEIVPDAGVRISKIKSLEDDIALSLSALGIRIIAPIPGKGTIGIEVPNQKPEVVSMRSVIASEKFQNNDMDLPIALGKTISNETFVTDLAKMPHLLMAGATGQGKSVGLNAILVSLLYKKHPSQLKLILVDPKKVELTLFNKIERHFLAKLPGTDEAIITDTKKVVNTLNSLCIEMDNRYELLKDAQVRNIKEYNAKFIVRRLNPQNGHQFLPYIVLVVDEFADLIMTAGKEVEMPIARLAQLARAIGIHLIIATQRPSVNIITGTIKANFPARIAFRVSSKIDSRTILDSGGADQLIGRGDMLLSTGNDLIRLQCAFVDTPEVESITEFIGNQRGYPEAFMLPEYVDENEGGGTKEMDPADRDPLFKEAARMVVIHQQGSASLLQRRLKLGYNRAGRIVDQLEAAGIIGPFEGSKARQVLYPDEHSLEQYLNEG